MNLRRSAWDQVDTTTLIEAAERRATRQIWGWGLLGGGALAAVGGVAAYAVADATEKSNLGTSYAGKPTCTPGYLTDAGPLAGLRPAQSRRSPALVG